MKNEEKLKKKETKLRSLQLAIRLSPEELTAIKSIAELQGKKCATLIRESCLAYLRNFSEHEHLFDQIKSADPQEVEQTIFDVLNRNTETIDKSLKNLEVEMLKKFDLIDVLERKAIFLHYFFNREVGDEDYAKLEKSANRRTKVFLEDVK